MKAMVKQIEGCSFIGKADSNHWVSIDTKKEASGSDAATHPMEFILLALGSCMGCDVISILQKKKVSLKGFEIRIDAERAVEHPRVFTKIRLELLFIGAGLDPVPLERAIELSLQKYCPVSAMLKKSVSISTSYRIIEEPQ
jgi:putative redox protein